MSCRAAGPAPALAPIERRVDERDQAVPLGEPDQAVPILDLAGQWRETGRPPAVGAGASQQQPLFGTLCDRHGQAVYQAGGSGRREEVWACGGVGVWECH